MLKNPWEPDKQTKEEYKDMGTMDQWMRHSG